LQNVTTTIEDVYAEDLDVLDSLIETGEDEEEYKEKVKEMYSFK